MNTLSAVRAGYGLARLLTPLPRPDRETPRPKDGKGPIVARVLGARHLAQAVISAPAPSPALLSLGVEADLLHAASMLALAALDRRWRRAALAEGTVAFGFAAAGTVAARHAALHPPTLTRAHTLLEARDRWARSLAERTLPGPLLHTGSNGMPESARPIGDHSR